SGRTGKVVSVGLPLFVNMPSCPQEVNRVDRSAPEPDLVVQVRRRAASGAAHGAHTLADGYVVPTLHLDIAQMSVPSLKTVAVVDLDSIAITRANASEHHSPRRGCDNWRTLEGGHVEAGMVARPARERVDSLPVARGLAVIHGDRRGERG